MSTTVLPSPELRGAGSVRYRCAGCGADMDPADAVLQDGRSWHPEHSPKEGEAWPQTPD